LPVLRLLKKHWPKAEVYWWLGNEFGTAAGGRPDLAGIIPLRAINGRIRGLDADILRTIAVDARSSI